jgi:hypothetical protein
VPGGGIGRIRDSRSRLRRTQLTESALYQSLAEFRGTSWNSVELLERETRLELAAGFDSTLSGG